LVVRRSPPLVELWPSQVIAIPKINEGDSGSRPNFLVKMPTSAGKTNIAELSILRFLIDGFPQSGKKCIYIAPFHALGAQTEARLQRDFSPLGVGVSDLYGGFEVSPADPFLFNQQRILVATPEKVDALLRFNPDFASQIGLIFIDEGHLIEDSERGLRFEMLIHRLVRRYANGGARLILASAVMGQADSLVHWITGATDANGLQASPFRPTRNYLGLLLWNGYTAIRELTHVSDENTGAMSSAKRPKTCGYALCPMPM
jgi:replicative superfamily II helicase